MTSLPPHGSLRRRSVLRALGVAASRALLPGLWLAGKASGQPVRPPEGELAGFELESRHADWAGAEFVADSPSHVSVYRLSPPG